MNEEIARLEAEVKHWKREAVRFWADAHAEYCSNIWPHEPGKVCEYEPPEGLTDAEIQEILDSNG